MLQVAGLQGQRAHVREPRSRAPLKRALSLRRIVKSANRIVRRVSRGCRGCSVCSAGIESQWQLDGERRRANILELQVSQHGEDSVRTWQQTWVSP